MKDIVTVCLFCVASAMFAAPPSWPEPTRESKPWVYNWWMGCAVDEKGLEAQCAALAEKGFGGFHVIPIYGAKGYESQYRAYLSDDWMKAFADAVRIAAAHGLDVDMTTGCGWCFGGPQISATNGCWRLRKRADGSAPNVPEASQLSTLPTSIGSLELAVLHGEPGAVEVVRTPQVARGRVVAERHLRPVLALGVLVVGTERHDR